MCRKYQALVRPVVIFKKTLWHTEMPIDLTWVHGDEYTDCTNYVGDYLSLLQTKLQTIRHYKDALITYKLHTKCF